jgi:hypothetical protein
LAQVLACGAQTDIVSSVSPQIQFATKSLISDTDEKQCRVSVEVGCLPRTGKERKDYRKWVRPAVSPVTISDPFKVAVSEYPIRIEIILCVLLIVVAAAFTGSLLRPCRPGDRSITAGSVILLAGCPREESTGKSIWQRARQMQ